MHGLANPTLKLLRAKIHLDTLRGEVDALIASKPYDVLIEEDHAAGLYIVKVVFKPPPIWPVGPIFGDFICCLRSSLDHLVSGLVRLGGGDDRRSAFPIIHVLDKETDRKIADKTHGLSPLAIDAIRDLQPYKHGSRYTESHLYKLERLWNVDKHRHVALHATSLTFNFPTMPKRLAGSVALDEDVAVMRFPAEAKPYLIGRALMPAFDFSFGDDAEKIAMTVTDLDSMYSFVSDSVIPRFMKFYPDPDNVHKGNTAP